MTSLPIVNASANITATANTEIHTNTSSSSFTVTLPTTPTNETIVRVLDIGRNWGVNHITIATGGSDKINGGSTMDIHMPGGSYDFVYISAVTEWIYFFDSKFDPNVVNNVTTNSYLTSTLSNNTLDLAVSSGSLTENVSSVLTLTGLTNSLLSSGTIQVKEANTTTSGYLNNTDWNTFNNKQNLITSPTANNFVYTNSNGQTIDSGVSLSLSASSNSNTQLMSSSAVQSAITASIANVLRLQGTWNASTNTPNLVAGTGTVGFAYYVSVAGTQAPPSGVSTFYSVGDLVFYTSTSIWERLESSSDVMSVFGRTGIITAQSGDYTIAQVTNGLSNVLNSANIFVGNGSSVATGVSLSGDATISNVGALTVSNNAINNGKLTQALQYTWKGNNTNATANVSDNNLGALTETGSSVLTIANGTHALVNPATIQVKQATTSQAGYLSSTDWNTFNNKQSTLTSGTSILTILSNVLNFANQAVNTVLAGPSSGGVGAPSFRTLVTTDIFPAILSGAFTAGALAVYNGTNFSPSTNLTWLSNVLTVSGTVVTNELKINETAEFQGVDTLGTSGRVVVNNTNVQANSRIYLTAQSVSASRGFLFISTRTVGTSFTIQSSQSTDRSVVAWLIINPS